MLQTKTVFLILCLQLFELVVEDLLLRSFYCFQNFPYRNFIGRICSKLYYPYHYHIISYHIGYYNWVSAILKFIFTKLYKFYSKSSDAVLTTVFRLIIFVHKTLSLDTISWFQVYLHDFWEINAFIAGGFL